MDAITITTLASTAISLLAPYLKSVIAGAGKKAGEQVGSKAGELAWDKANQLYEIIKAKFSAKRETKKIMSSLEKSPGDSDLQAVTRFHLKNMITKDEKFAQELAAILLEASNAGADVIFKTNIFGNVQEYVQINKINGNVTL